MKKRFIYICSPYRGDVENNVQFARDQCKSIMERHPDVIPVAPHLYFPQFLNDDDPAERALGMEAALELLDMCDEVWVYGRPTEGMKAEIARAVLQGIKVYIDVLIYREGKAYMISREACEEARRLIEGGGTT